MAAHFGFRQKQVYLPRKKDNLLVAQLDGDSKVGFEFIDPMDEQNPVADCFRTGVDKPYNMFFKKEAGYTDLPLFGTRRAICFALKSGGEVIGVFCLWQQLTENPPDMILLRRVGPVICKLFSSFALRIA